MLLDGCRGPDLQMGQRIQGDLSHREDHELPRREREGEGEREGERHTMSEGRFMTSNIILSSYILNLNLDVVVNEYRIKSKLY
jgi:hypothetical protein